MEWIKKLQSIIAYVENHLQRRQEPIDPKEISQIAGSSPNADFCQAAVSMVIGAKSRFPPDRENREGGTT